MREVLFRGKKSADGEWIEGAYFQPANTIILYQPVLINGVNTFMDFCIIPETVGQYTGRNVGADKLFEGDIIEWLEDYDDLWGDSRTYTGRSVVVWDSENACWALKTDTYIQPFNDFPWDRCYIVGNIHDNPELLKGEGK